MLICEALSWASQFLKKTSASPSLDAEVLLSSVHNKPKEFLFANPDCQLSKPQISKYRNLIAKRAAHWPVAYLTGHKEFFGLDFKVTPNVLIPRPETEILVELALKWLSPPVRRSPPLADEGGGGIAPSDSRGAGVVGERRNRINIIDLGTGSGNIIIGLAVILSRKNAAKNLNFFATDLSPKAHRVARLNARRHGVLNKIKFLRDHLLSPILKSKIFPHSRQPPLFNTQRISLQPRPQT